jgi:hypothetical protein
MLLFLFELLTFNTKRPDCILLCRSKPMKIDCVSIGSSLLTHNGHDHSNKDHDSDSYLLLQDVCPAQPIYKESFPQNTWLFELVENLCRQRFPAHEKYLELI